MHEDYKEMLVLLCQVYRESRSLLITTLVVITCPSCSKCMLGSWCKTLCDKPRASADHTQEAVHPKENDESFLNDT